MSSGTINCSWYIFRHKCYDKHTKISTSNAHLMSWGTIAGVKCLEEQSIGCDKFLDINLTTNILKFLRIMSI